MNITKTAMITVCGRPNVGKSSLTNALVGEKIAIVSDKPQTTRNRIYGVVNRGDTQYVLLDTPGLHKPRSRLGDYMVKVVRESLSDVECALLLVEPIPHVGEPEKVLLQRIREEQLPCVLCINKIDTVEKKEALLEVIAAYSAAYDGFDAIIPISARTGDGLDELMRQLSQYAQEGPQLFPDGMTTDQADSQVCAEIVREKMLRCLDKEIPHGTAVEVTKFSEREDTGIIDLDVTIYCEKASHKGIIIGRGGEMLKRISSAARRDIEKTGESSHANDMEVFAWTTGNYFWTPARRRRICCTAGPRRLYAKWKDRDRRRGAAGHRHKGDRSDIDGADGGPGEDTPDRPGCAAKEQPPGGGLPDAGLFRADHFQARQLVYAG